MKKIFTIALVLLFTFTGCAKETIGENSNDTPDVTTFVHEGVGNWELEIIEGYEIVDELNEDGFIQWVYGNGDYRIMIFEKENIDYEINEDLFEQVATADGEFNVEKFETINIDNMNTIYGAVIEDHATETDYNYFMTDIDKNSVEIIFMKKGVALTTEDEINVKYMISTLKKKVN